MLFPFSRPSALFSPLFFPSTAVSHLFPSNAKNTTTRVRQSGKTGRFADFSPSLPFCKELFFGCSRTAATTTITSAILTFHLAFTLLSGLVWFSLSVCVCVLSSMVSAFFFCRSDLRCLLSSTTSTSDKFIAALASEEHSDPIWAGLKRKFPRNDTFISANLLAFIRLRHWQYYSHRHRLILQVAPNCFTVTVVVLLVVQCWRYLVWIAATAAASGNHHQKPGG